MTCGHLAVFQIGIASGPFPREQGMPGQRLPMRAHARAELSCGGMSANKIAASLLLG